MERLRRLFGDLEKGGYKRWAKTALGLSDEAIEIWIKDGQRLEAKEIQERQEVLQKGERSVTEKPNR